jgi:hypothetical protein
MLNRLSPIARLLVVSTVPFLNALPAHAQLPMIGARQMFHQVHSRMTQRFFPIFEEFERQKSMSPKDIDRAFDAKMAQLEAALTFAKTPQKHSAGWGYKKDQEPNPYFDYKEFLKDGSDGDPIDVDEYQNPKHWAKIWNETDPEEEKPDSADTKKKPIDPKKAEAKALAYLESPTGREKAAKYLKSDKATEKEALKDLVSGLMGAFQGKPAAVSDPTSSDRESDDRRIIQKKGKTK